MRTTLQIDEDVFQAARSLARAEHKTLGQVLSELARKGLAPKAPERKRGAFPTFEVPRSAPPITLEMVQQAGEEG